MEYETIEKIQSRDNNRIKVLKKLGQKKYRSTYGLFLVENLRIIEDAFLDSIYFEELFITENFARSHEAKIALFQKEGRKIFMIDERLNRDISQLDTPSGIIATYQIRPQTPEAGQPAVYLNGLNDPGNLGTIMRTALAFGFFNIVVDGQTADPYNPKTVSAAKDSILKLNVSLDKTGDWLVNNKENYLVVVADVHGKGMAEVPVGKAICLVLGSESHGVDPQVLALADQRIRIPISAQIESLNVAAAAAIMLYHFRQI